LRTFVTGLVCVLIAGTALGQSNSQPVLKPRNNAPVQDLPSAPADQNIPMTAPVITIHGVCDKGTAATPDCNTVVTRADFEKLVNAVKPDLPKPQQKQLAAGYVQAVVLAKRGHEMGLDQGPAFEEQMQLQRLQLLARLAGENLQKEAGQVTDAELDAYYKQHANQFETISYDKLYIPKQRESTAATSASTGAGAQKKTETSEAAMKEEADKLRARAANGEDFTKLQQEAYTISGQKLKADPNSTRVNNVAKGHFPPSDASVFDLKVGEVSPVLDDAQAFMVYKIEAKQEQPLADVRAEVSRMVQQQKLQDLSQAIRKTVMEDTTYDNAYFAVPAAPSLKNPGEAPAPSAPGTQSSAPGKK
jgi:hypothetical protein